PSAPFTSTLSLHDALPIFAAFLGAQDREVAGDLRPRIIDAITKDNRRFAPLVRLRQAAAVTQQGANRREQAGLALVGGGILEGGDRKSTRLNSSHDQISYA